MQFLLNPIYKALAGLAVILLVTGGAYIKGRSDAYDSAHVAQLEQSLKTEREARAVDAINASAAKAYLGTLEVRIKDLNDYAASLEDGRSVCLSGNDTDRLRNLWD